MQTCKNARSLYLICIAACLCLCISFAVRASTKDDLKQTQTEIEQSKTKQQAIAAKHKKLQKELKLLQEKTVRLAETIQEAEADISSTEEKMRILSEQQITKAAELVSRRKQLAILVQAAIKLEQVPPESIVMMPGDSEQAMKASRALEMTTDGIKRETESLHQQLAELDELKARIARHHEDLIKKQTMLADEQQELNKRLGERQHLQEKLGSEEKEESAKLAALGKKAGDLQDLLQRLSEEHSRNRHHAPLMGEPEEVTQDEEASGGGTKGHLRSFADARGHIRAPVAGRLVQRYGEQARNETSKGITIEARSGAQVTAPYDGEVLFTGPFLNYGRIVILRHSDDFHTLMAGLAKIEVKVGEFLLEGEPIGAMGDSENQKRLYVELRKDNQPVDPAPWIHGLK